MDEKELLERALQRERKARAKAEQLLENKSRELFLSHNELSQQYNEIIQKKRELELFFTITNISDNHIKKTDIIQNFTQAVCQLCEWEIAHVFLVDGMSESSVITDSNIWHQENKQDYNDLINLTQETSFSYGIGLPGQVVKCQHAVWIDDVFSDDDFARSKPGRELNLHSAFGVPIFCDDKIIAIAEFFSEKAQKKDQSLLNIIEAASKQLTIVLERRLAEKQLEENFQQLKQTHEQLKDTQSQLMQNSKLASIGQLAAGVAHEINNPISFVASNHSILSKYLINIKNVVTETKNNLTDSSNNLEDIKNNILTLMKKNNIGFIIDDIDVLVKDSIDGMERVSDIVAGLKSFSRVDEAEVKAININEHIDSTIKIIWNELKYKCTLNKDYGDLPLVHCNASQINQVLLNMIVNAGHAIEEKGEISVKTSLQDSYIKIDISDTGTGIEKEHLDKLYDPFFTTKPVGEGTGLGLSISYGIIQNHGGKIDVDSTVGKGTTFSIQIPIEQEEKTVN